MQGVIKGSLPEIQDNANGIKSLAVTNADTGLPGKAKIKDLPNLANVVGFPGFILSLPK